ncbi:MAG: hypothetical protein JRJ69_05555 [Deltaproteobacteria bacterium]|nr:hypothetical protein [Deltaproteobacteria bacterium]
MQAMITLTSEESKRLIAKGIAAMDSVQKAKRDGFIGFSLCTSCGYIIQELLGKDMVDPSRYCCGFIYGKGSCGVPGKNREKLLLLKKGKPCWLNFPEENLTKYIDYMGTDDIIIKSGNLLDPSGAAGVLVSSPDGGEAGAYLPHIAARGIQLIVPMPLNKTVPLHLTEILPYMGITKFRRDRVHGLSCGMLALPGKVVTEVGALRDLFGVQAIPAAMAGVGSGDGTVTMALVGGEKDVETAWQYINHIKGEQKLKNYFSTCKECIASKSDAREAQCSTRSWARPK